jgi:UrcA family protein
MLARIVCVALAASTLATGKAAADPSAENGPSVRVSYADLNLQSPAGAQTMYARLENAARHVCDDRAGIRPVIELRALHACVAAALNHAVADLDQPLVTSLYAEGHSLGAREGAYTQAAR